MTSETIPLGCPDCGARWPEVPGPLADLDGQRFDCPACGRGWHAHTTLKLYLTRT